MTLMAPRDEAMLVAHAAHRAVVRRGPDRAALPARRGRGRAAAGATRSRSRSARGEILREGRRVALLGYGSGVAKALEAADLLAAQGVDATVADARFAKPLDGALLAQLCGEHDAARHDRGGRAARAASARAVWEHLNDAGVAAPRILRVGLPDRYVTHGKPALLHSEVGFTGKAIARRVVRVARRRRRGRRRGLRPSAVAGGGRTPAARRVIRWRS